MQRATSAVSRIPVIPAVSNADKMALNPTGLWYDEHGCELEIFAAPDGCITGVFRGARGHAFPDECGVVGFVAGDLVSFVADFARLHSLTAWAGHLVTGDDERLDLLWHRTVESRVQDDAQDVWKGVWNGADVFRRRRTSSDQNPASVPSHPIGHEHRAH